jgi:hypothetical protein
MSHTPVSGGGAHSSVRAGESRTPWQERGDLRPTSPERMIGRGAPDASDAITRAREGCPIRPERHAVARGAEVRDRGFHRAGAGRGEEQDVVFGAADGLQPLEHLAEERAVVRAAVVDDRLGERSEDLRGHRCRPRGEEVPLLGHSASA